MSGNSVGSPAPPPALRARGVVRKFGAREILAGVDLDVPAGAAFGLVGANGAGKTTLIKCILDLSRPERGTIELFGVSNREPEARRRLASVPERFVPPYYLLGREFIEMTRRLAGAPPAPESIRRLCAELELEAEALARPVRQLSKGMTQKLGLIACLLVERDLYVLDEPMSGLDPASRVAVKTVLARLAAQGRTLLFTSQVLADIEELCASLAILEQGRILFRGAPAELRARYPATDLEQSFIRCIRAP
ncbi:MAG: ABC transporter ATP-binding protein [Betaproteobacteria bacterium]|nr:ABC transporter ATP-binding protein [Betaproteobacteria bacterium]